MLDTKNKNNVNTKAVKMRPASTFILSSVNPHALAGFPGELKPCVDEALQDPEIFRKILKNPTIATNPQFFDMITTKMGKEHPALLMDAMTQPAVMESLEEIDPRMAHKIALVNSKFAVDETIEAIYENASANLLKLSSRQDPAALLEFVTEGSVFPILIMEDNTLPSDLADIFEEEFGGLGTLDNDEALIRDLRDLSRVASGATLGGDTLGIWGSIVSGAKKIVKTVKAKVKQVKTKAKKLYTRAKTSVKTAYNNTKTKLRNAASKTKTYVQNKAKNAVNAAKKVRDYAVSKAKAAQAVVVARAKSVKAAVVARAKSVQAAAVKAKDFAVAKLAAAKKAARDIGNRIKASKDAAIAKAKKLYAGIKTGISNGVTKAKNLVGGAAQKLKEYKDAAIQKAKDYKKKVDDFKAAIKQKAADQYLKTKEYLANKAKAAWEKAKNAKEWGKQKLSGAMQSAGRVMKAGSDLMKKGKDIMVGAGKGALNWGLGAAKKTGGALLGAGKTIGKALISPWTAAGKMGYMGAEAISNWLANRAEDQEAAEEEDPGELIEEMLPEDLMEMSEMYSPAGMGMEGYPEEEYMEEPYMEEEGLPPGAECVEGEEMPEEQMVCFGGKWVCKEGAKYDIGDGAFMVCTNGEWGMPEDEAGQLPYGAELPSGAEAGLPEGHVCTIGDREEIVAGVFMECVNGQWLMPGEPGMPAEEGYLPFEPGMPAEEGYMPAEEGYMPGEPGMPAEEYYSPAEEGGYVAPEMEDMWDLPEEIREQIAGEIQDVTMPEAEEWSEEGPVPGTVVPMAETGLPQIPVPIFGIDIAKMVGWEGRTIEFQEIIPGIRASPLPWFIPIIEQIPLLPGIIIRDEDGLIVQEGMRLPTLPRSLVGLPAIPIPKQLPKPDFGYDATGEDESGYYVAGENELGFRTNRYTLEDLGFHRRGYILG